MLSVVLLAYSVYFILSMPPKKIIRFSNPVLDNCVTVRNVTKDISMLYTIDGEYDGVLTNTGCIYSFALEIENGNTYIIYAEDYKESKPRTEFYLYIDSDEIYVDIPRSIRNNNENMFVCCDKKTIHEISDKLRKTYMILKKDLPGVKQYLPKSKQQESRVKLNDEALIILSCDNKEIKFGQLIPFLYIKVENTTHFEVFIQNTKLLKSKIRYFLWDLFEFVKYLSR